ncbi:MAG: TIGR03013 family XrtA/PEP-CTERM system glycosyltransferase [Planctomycetota bacterium]
MLSVLRHYLPIRKALLIVSETAILTLCLATWLSGHLWNPSEDIQKLLLRGIPALTAHDAILRCVTSSFFLALIAQIAIAFNELYDVRISSSFHDRAARFVESAGSALALTLFAVVLVDRWELKHLLDTPPLSTSQRMQTLVFAMLCAFALLYGWRSLFHFLLQRPNFADRVLILGSGSSARELAREILERPDAGYAVVGLLPDPGEEGRETAGDRRRIGTGTGPGPAARAAPSGEFSTARLRSAMEEQAEEKVDPKLDAATAALLLEPLPEPAAQGSAETPVAHPHSGNGSAVSGRPKTLLGLAQSLRVDILVVALEDRRAGLPIEELLQCRLAGIVVREQEALYERITGKIAVQALRPSYLIFNEGFSVHPWGDLLKRSVDIALSSIGILLSWPLMLATAIAVRLDSPGPILFRQERVGRDGLSFTLLKFRSMRADAEKTTGPVWASEDDPRITRSGRFIRRARLDELPQLWNVLAGQMSMVGPRPERPVFVEELAKKIPYFRQRHIVKPGLTGWAQISYRYGASFQDSVQKLQYDLFYIKNQSLLFDLSILFNTVKIVILRKGT